MTVYRLGPLTIDTDRVEIRDGTGLVDAPRLTVELLVALTEVAPDTARNAELLGRLWPGRYVGDANLKQRVYQLRKLVEPYGLSVETKRGWGYALRSTPEILSSTGGGDTLEYADLALERLEFGKAAALLEVWIEDHPDDAMARVSLAWTHVWRGDLAAARAEVDAAVSMSASVPIPQRFVVDAIAAAFDGDVQRSIDSYELASSMLEHPRWAAINLAGSYMLVGRIADAIAVYRDLQAADASDPQPFWDEGLCRFQALGDLAGLVAGVTAASDRGLLPLIEIEAMLPAFSAWADGNYPLAIETFEDALAERMPGLRPVARVHALLARARMLACAGDIEGALVDLAAARQPLQQEDPWRSYLELEEALLTDDSGLLERIAEQGSTLNRAKALGWIALSDPEGSQGGLCRLRELEATGLPEWGLPITVALRQAQAAFPLLVDGERALAAGREKSAQVAFQRALAVAPSGVHGPIPLVALGPRPHLVARAGLARCGLSSHDEWITTNMVIAQMVAQAGAPIVERARLRLSQPA